MNIYKTNKIFDSERFEKLKQFKETTFDNLELYIMESNNEFNYGFIVDKSKKQFLSCLIQGEFDELENVKVYIGDDFIKASFEKLPLFDDFVGLVKIDFNKIQIDKNEKKYLGTFEDFYEKFIKKNAIKASFF